jgi:pyruvate,water dikinase
LEENGLEHMVTAFLNGGDSVTDEQYRDLCAQVQQAPLPDSLQGQLRESTQRLLEQSSVGLAVRSSSLVEDSKEASFAGIFDSVLGVNSLQAVEEALRRCWCAGWSPSAMRYARQHDLKLAPDHMAVIVQELVEAQSAGVLFTAEALTGNPWVFSLEACHGLAAELVAGDAAADTGRWRGTPAR